MSRIAACDKFMVPRYDLEKIKSGTDQKTWERALAIFNAGKITEFAESPSGYTAQVLGSAAYDVAISEIYCHQGDCNCFVGQQGIVCKHMIALAIFAVNNFN